MFWTAVIYLLAKEAGGAILISSRLFHTVLTNGQMNHLQPHK